MRFSFSHLSKSLVGYHIFSFYIFTKVIACLQFLFGSRKKWKRKFSSSLLFPSSSNFRVKIFSFHHRIIISLAFLLLWKSILEAGERFQTWNVYSLAHFGCVGDSENVIFSYFHPFCSVIINSSRRPSPPIYLRFLSLLSFPLFNFTRTKMLNVRNAKPEWAQHTR